MKLMITGANGFVGGYLTPRLDQEGHQLTKIVREPAKGEDAKSVFSVGDIKGETDWRLAVENQDVIIHLANRAHVMEDEEPNPLSAYRRVNVEGTLSLARQSVEAGVKRFIYLSSIKVNGEETRESMFQHSDSPEPQDNYAISKKEAEQGLKEVCRDSNMELVIIRPPLVYGPGVKGNLRTLKNIIEKGWPLPLGGIYNQRDLISVDNLVDLITTCVSHPKAAGQTFLCSDERPVSTTELIRRIANARRRRARFFWMPRALIRSAAVCLGKEGAYNRLFGSLRVDISFTKSVLGWSPPFLFEDELVKAFESTVADGSRGDD